MQSTRTLAPQSPSSASLSPSASGSPSHPISHAPQAPSVGRLVQRLLTTTADPAPTVARTVLALVMFPHGAQHALGWFGGYGFSGTHGWMITTLGIPAPLAALAIITELLAPIALLLGLAGRLAAAGIFALMAVAATTHAPTGFFMNWFGKLPAGAEGFELHLLAMALAAVVVISGSGAWSLDRRLQPRVR